MTGLLKNVTILRGMPVRRDGPPVVYEVNVNDEDGTVVESRTFVNPIHAGLWALSWIPLPVLTYGEGVLDECALDLLAGDLLA